MSGEVIGGTGHRDGQAAMIDVFQRCEHIFGVLSLLNDFLVVMVQLLPGLGEVKRFTNKLKKFQPDALFQLLDLHGDSWLGQV